MKEDRKGTTSTGDFQEGTERKEGRNGTEGGKERTNSIWKTERKDGRQAGRKDRRVCMNGGRKGESKDPLWLHFPR
jgi:hypothetical protein